ncbi:MAG: DUF2848 family protein [Candidatus Rokubacteria bacterium]|nr:DUF2848 family protein [Candidatus Rokubacteria bacterium]
MHPELPLVVESREGHEPLPFTVRRIVCGGYTGRNRAEVERHTKELEALGIAPPKETPIFFSVASYLATVGSAIEVQGPFTSGEVEFVLLFGPGGSWVTVGSDQTDRFFERHSMAAAKQLCPKVIAGTVWPVAEVEAHWDAPPLPGGPAGDDAPACRARPGRAPPRGPGARGRGLLLRHRPDGGRRGRLRRRLGAGAGRLAPRPSDTHAVRRPGPRPRQTLVLPSPPGGEGRGEGEHPWKPSNSRTLPPSAPRIRRSSRTPVSGSGSTSSRR